jgi:poly(A) polymerase
MPRTLIVKEKLSTCPWADEAAFWAVYRALNDDGRAPLTLVVGGAVRNAVMGRAITDIDLATILTPTQVTERAVAAGLRAIETGLEHGTITVVADGQGFEVTTLRADVATDGRHAVVAFTDDWAVDAARRDFTMNALYADIDGNVYDPLGMGLADARAGHVRFVGDASTRIAEDYLRILRFFRFTAHYGQGAVDKDAVSACAAAAQHLPTLSRERITDELVKWLGAVDPMPTLRTAYARGIMRYVLPGACDLDVLSRVVAMQKQINQLCHPGESRDPEKDGPRPSPGRQDCVLLRLLILLDGIDPQTVLRLSNKDMDFMRAVEQTVLNPALTEASLKQDIYWHGRDVVWARLFLDLAELELTSVPAKLAATLRLLQTWPVPKFPVTGADLMAREGLKPGPDLGARLRELEVAWVNGGFKDL